MARLGHAIRSRALSRSGRARSNAVLLGADYAVFLVGWSFGSVWTMLPAFAAGLGAPNAVIGLIPAAMTLGPLAALCAAPSTVRARPQHAVVVRLALVQRLPLVAIALAAFVLAPRTPRTALAVVLAMVVVMALGGGGMTIAWTALVARCVSATSLGRFLGIAGALGNLGGVAAAAVTAHILEALPSHAGFGACFLVAGVLTTAPVLFLHLVREPPAETPPEASGTATPVREVIGGDANFARFLGARALGVAGAMAGGFFAVHALRALPVATAALGTFTAAMLLGQIAGNLIFGWLADRAGHRRVIVAGLAAMVAANAAAFGAGSLPLALAPFVLTGVHQAAFMVSGLMILARFAGAPTRVAAYVAVGNALIAPVAFVAPIAAGFVADRLGFAALFVAAGSLGIAGAAAMLCLVRDPAAPTA